MRLQPLISVVDSSHSACHESNGVTGLHSGQASKLAELDMVVHDTTREVARAVEQQLIRMGTTRARRLCRGENSSVRQVHRSWSEPTSSFVCCSRILPVHCSTANAEDCLALHYGPLVSLLMDAKDSELSTAGIFTHKCVNSLLNTEQRRIEMRNNCRSCQKQSKYQKYERLRNVKSKVLDRIERKGQTSRS